MTNRSIEKIKKEAISFIEKSDEETCFLLFSEAHVMGAGMCLKELLSIREIIEDLIKEMKDKKK